MIAVLRSLRQVGAVVAVESGRLLDVTVDSRFLSHYWVKSAGISAVLCVLAGLLP